MGSIKRILPALIIMLFLPFLSTCSWIETLTSPLFGLTLSFRLTDAPLSSSSVREVWVTISSLSLHLADSAEDEGEWKTMDFDPPQELDLLSLNNGLTEELGSASLPAGSKVTQLRLGVDSVRIVESGGLSAEAQMPSESGLKVVGNLDLPLTGSVSFTIDFDAAKSIVRNPGRGYILKPALRVVPTWEAGRINGTAGSGGVSLVYAYADGSWSASEAMESGDGSAFAHSYASTLPTLSGSWVLAFLEPGTYDLIGVDASGSVVAIIENVLVSSGKATEADGFH